MTEAELKAVADRCAQVVVTWGGDRGLSERDLLGRVPELSALDSDGRFRALTLLAQHRYVASDSRAGEWRFWGRHRAPAGAYMAPT